MKEAGRAFRLLRFHGLLASILENGVALAPLELPFLSAAFGWREIFMPTPPTG
jgi:hypothetical protein